MSVWNGNLTGHAVFLSAVFGNPTWSGGAVRVGRDVALVPWGGRGTTGKLSAVLHFGPYSRPQSLVAEIQAFAVCLLRWAPKLSMSGNCCR